MRFRLGVVLACVYTLVVGAAAPISQTQPAAPSQNSSVEYDEPMDWSWLWLVAVSAGVGLVAVVAAGKAKDRRQLAALRVIPRQHAGRPRVVVATRGRDEVGND
jgi:hypothetical protein